MSFVVQDKIGDPLPIDNHLEALAQIEDLRKQLHMMKRSFSWRITAPLRLIVTILISILKMLIYVPLKIIGPRLDQNPDFTYRVIEGLRKFPRLHGILSRSLAQTRGLHHSTKQSLLSPLNPAMNTLDHKFVWGSSPKPIDGLILNQTVLFYVGHTASYPQNTGIQRVTRRFAAALLEQGYGVLFVKWNNQKNTMSEISFKEFESLSKWNGPKFFDRRSLTDIDLTNMHLIFPELPYSDQDHQCSVHKVARWARENAVTTSAIFYDDIPLRIDYGPTHRALHVNYMMDLLEVDYIMSISDYTKEQIIDFWKIADLPEGTIKPTVYSVPLATNSFSEASFSPYNAQSRMILCVGTIEYRKNQLTLISAFNKYIEANPESDWKLHLVGSIAKDVKIQFESLIQNSQNIVYHGPVDDSYLTDLYNRCSFTVCSSIEEGYGLPIAESLSHGRPNICANFGAMAEVASIGGCLMTDVRSVKDLADAIHLLTTQVGHRTFLQSQIPAPKDLRSWSDYSDEYMTKCSAYQKTSDDLGVIYYLLDSTIQFKRNTGIQRVVRQTAVALLNSGFHLIPATWDFDQQSFTTVPQEDLEFVALWNGPTVESWSPWVNPDEAPENSWLIEAEIPTSRPPEFHTDMIRCARNFALKTAHIFYDAIPVTLEYLYPKENTLRHALYMEQLTHYDLVVPISVHSANDLGRFLFEKGSTYRTIEHKIQPIELAGEFTETPRIRFAKSTVSTKPKILMVSTLEPRKNHQTLLNAFEIAHGKLKGQLELVLVGHYNYPDVVQLVESFITKYPNISWERNADDTMLQALYSNCDFTVYPSIEEGFGLPILESQWNARPCICSDSGSMNEIAAGGGALTVPITDAEALASAIVNMINDESLYAKLSQECVSRKFKTWTDYGDELVSVMRQI
jgi:glycosyltransferase involved in cell wall biosynthesis